MSSNMDRLGGILSDRMKQTSQSAVPTTVELGLINGDLSLTVDSIGTPIPQKDYMVDLRLTHETYYTYTELKSSKNAPHVHVGPDHTHSTDGLHDHRVSSVFRRLEPGDRVLVIWVGHEPIIVCIVVAGTTITPN